jgi:hypothetical protein
MCGRIPFYSALNSTLGFDDKVQALRPVLLDQNGPVRVIGGERRWDFEPARKLSIINKVID